ncbi:hypothetical protein ACFLS1_04540 [Verrucomicrobiota bacterium]
MTLKTKNLKLSREDIAKQEIGHTEVAPGLARVITIIFLIMVVAVPCFQNAEMFQKLRWSGVEQAWREKSSGIFKRCITANAALLKEMNIYEDGLEESSILRMKLLGPVQQAMLRFLGQGNEKVYPGNDGWLYFRPGVDYVTGPGFLEQWLIRKRRLSGNEYTLPPQPDPRKAILQFHHQLEKEGIMLIVVPVPGKASVHPEFLMSCFGAGQHLFQNASFDCFKRELEAAGVRIFDPVPVFEELIGFSGMPQYLRGDTHWKPGAMEAIAKRLSAYIEREVELQPRRAAYKRRQVRVSHVGDLVLALNLPEDQHLFAKEDISIRQVYDGRSGNLWGPIRSAEVLVLGDSFSNIYSLDTMRWGESAGFVEQISYFLQRPVDAIIQNNDGAHATRRMLYRQLERDPGRLTGKKVVIWQFAERELSEGDWRVTR